MSNVYNFDDKILHIESLQLKRTDEILNSRDEAVEALLNYCGDDTMDGMPLLARYWADSGQTEIKHIRGYIHNIDGHMGISVDDIVDVDEIYDYIDSAITANTKECKVSYWESNYMHTNNIPLAEAYNTRHGGYKMAKKELLYSQYLTDKMADKPGGDSVRGDENPVLYVTNIEDDRRKGLKNWFGNQYSNITAHRHDGPEDGSVNYSLLTVFSKAVRSHKHAFPANADYYKGVILDTRKYERKIHQALYQSEKAQGKNDNFVVKKVFPLNPNQAYRYYYPGGIVKFMIPVVAPGVSVEIRFPKHYNLLNGDLNESFHNQLMRNSGRNYWRSDNVSVNFFTNESEYNYLLIVNSGDKSTATKASITLKNKIMDNLVLTPINSTLTYRVFATDYVNSQGRPYDGGGYTYFNCLNRVDTGHKGFIFDYTNKFNEDKIYGLTAKSPAMGFVIEQGKIKCYRKSNIEDFFDASSCYIKHIKDGTSFYYNERNVSNCGISFAIVNKHRDCLRSIVDMKKTEGRVEYLGIVRRRKIYLDPGDAYIDNACKFWARPDHVASDGTYSFIVGKTESNYKVSVLKIGVSFIGTDGETKEGYFNTRSNEPLPRNANEYAYEAREFYMKMKNGEYQYFGILSSDFTNSMKVTYMEFDIGNEDEKALRFIGCCSTSSPRYFRNSRTKWKIINHSNMLARNFTRSNFNRCRYFRKYRGVPSEFPEYFYTR